MICKYCRNEVDMLPPAVFLYDYECPRCGYIKLSYKIDLARAKLNESLKMSWMKAKKKREKRSNR